jgi:hypothetical protein
MSYVERFNTITKNFLTDLHNILPEEKDIKVFKSQLSVLEMMDPSKIIKSFVEFVYPYKEHILKKNEDFFLGNLEIEDDYLSESIHLKDLWKSKLSDENKEIVWKYFKIMVVLSDKYLGK